MFERFHIIVGCILCLCQSQMIEKGLQASEAPSMLSQLTEKDRILKSAGYRIFFVSATTDNKFRDPNQGMVFTYCEAALRANGSLAMKMTYYYEHPPVYGQRGRHRYEAIDFDRENNLMVCRPLEQYIVSDGGRNEALTIIRCYYVTPEGEVREGSGTVSMLFRGRVGSSDNLHEFNQFQMAVGRGLSEHLQTVLTSEQLSSGLVRATVAGTYGAGFPGKWDLTVDPNAGYLVRQATLRPQGLTHDTVSVTSEGVLSRDGLQLGERGTFRYANSPELSFETLDITRLIEPDALYAEVVARLNEPLPPGSEIIDLRGPTHTQTTVPRKP